MKEIDSYRSLVAAMVEHAVMDYRRAKARMKAEPDDAAAKAMVGEVEEFLESDWFRELLDISITRQGPMLRIRFTGSGFLYNMVRILVGTLLEVGSGQRSPGDMSRILEARDRQAAGFTAPAQGLFLWEQKY